MPATIVLLAEVIDSGLSMLRMTLADFSDQEMLVRPCPGANHANWQLGHLTGVEANWVRMADPLAMPDPPIELTQRYTSAAAGLDDASCFLRRERLLQHLADVRRQTTAWIRTLDPSRLGQPAPQALQQMAPTLGHMLHLIHGHQMMHLGQMQTIRRKLGKPVLF